MPHITIGAARCFYRTGMSPAAADGNTLILLHGSGGDSSVWEKQLGANIALIAPDLPGHGQSEGPLRSSAQEYAVWLDTFTRASGIKKFFLAGHSLGGAIAQEFGRAFPLKIVGAYSRGNRYPCRYYCRVSGNAQD